MTGWIEDNLLEFEGVSPNDIALLNRDLPDIIKAVNLISPHLPTLTRIVQQVLKKQQELK